MECFATCPSAPPHPRARWRYAGSNCQEFSMSQMSPAVAAYDQRAADYDAWYDDNPALYRAELDLVGDLLRSEERRVENERSSRIEPDEPSHSDDMLRTV